MLTAFRVIQDLSDVRKYQFNKLHNPKFALPIDYYTVRPHILEYLIRTKLGLGDH